MHTYAPFINWINTQEEALLERLRKWVNINTYSYNVVGLGNLLDLLTDDFKLLGGNLEIIALPPQKIFENGAFHDRPLGQALRLRHRPDAPIQLFLGGHYDTVFEPSTPFQTVQMEQKRIWKGPGISDMKGGLAIMRTAVEALEKSPLAQNIGWEILLTPDEEIGSPASTTLYQEAAKRNQVGLLFEPSFSDGAFVSERKGSANYTLVIRGKSAHVGRDFHQGKSAVVAIARFIHELAAIQQSQEMTINIADLEGKGPVNIVPSLATCRINFRSMQASSLANAFSDLQQVAQKVQSEGIQIEIYKDTYRPPKLFNAATHKLFDSFASCAKELNIPFFHRSTGGVCDGNTLAEAGMPTLDTAGAIGGGLHTYDEFLNLSSLIERAKLAALFMLKLANHEITINRETAHG